MNDQSPPSAEPVGASHLGDEQPAIDVWRYARMIRKRIWIIAAVVAIGVTASVLYTKRQPKIYRATASMVIDPTPPQVYGSQVQEVIQLGAGSYWSNQEYYNTQLQVLTKYDLARRTVSNEKFQPLTARLIDSAGAPDAAEPASPEGQIHLAAELLTGMLSASQNRESRIINLHVHHTDPALAVDLANAHVDEFLAYSKRVRGEEVKDIIPILDEQLSDAETALQAADQALLDYKEQNDLLSVSLEDKQNLLAADLSRYTAALSDARIKRIELGAVRRRAQALKGEDVMESPIFALASNSGVVDTLKEQYARAKHRLAELSQELGPRHPEFQNQQKKVDEQLQAIQVEARRALREIDERFQAASAGEKQFEAEVNRLKAEAFEIGPKTVAFNQLKRKQTSAEEQYQQLLNRNRVSKLTEENEATNVSKHTQARQAVLVYPRMTVNVAIAGLLSLVLGLGLVFLLDFMDRTIKSEVDIERLVKAPVLGTIPKVDADDLDGGDRREIQRARDLYVAHNPAKSVAEHCRSIRTNILFSSANRPMKTLTISSPDQQEGKTTTTIYLGTIMAQSKQRVLLVDTDMRKPRLHDSLLGTKHVKRGFSHLLLPDTNVDEALDELICSTEIPNLDLLPCGQRPPNPAELLLGERFRDVLAKLEERYDRILLDSPPLVLINDAVVLSRLSDGVIMVAQSGKTTIDHLTRATRMIRDVNAPILGVILNDVRPTSTGYYYYYYNSDYGASDEPDDQTERAA